VFLDRDGTINVDTHYPHKVELLRLLPRALRGLKLLSRLPLDIIVISNQAGIDLGMFTREQMSRFNAELRCRAERAGARIDAFYFCPDLEPRNLPVGATPSSCSKPAPGMLLEAVADFDLDLASSFLIGDKTSDIAAGFNAHPQLVTVLVQTGKAGNEESALPITPRHVVPDLYDAACLVQHYLFQESGAVADLGAYEQHSRFGVTTHIAH